MQVLISKFYETVFSVLPVTLLVLVLSFFVVPMDQEMLLRFILGATLIILGLSIFLFGVDLAITPVGNAMGSALARKKNVALLIGAGLILGFFINIAEPDLLVVAYQIRDVTGGLLSAVSILLVVSLGIGVMVAVGLLRIVLQVTLKNVLLVIYLAVLVLAVFAPRDFLGIAFDTGGATTGSMTVPFILALGMGVSQVHGGRRAEEDSFGLTAVASGGPMLAVFSMALIGGLGSLSSASLSEEASLASGVIEPFVAAFRTLGLEVLMAITPLILITLIAQKTLLHIGRRTFRRILKGFLYTFFGFVLFLTGVNAGFMEAGKHLGDALVFFYPGVVIGVGAVIGLLVILAEPSVHVLTMQVEEASGGAVKRSAILVALAIGVSLAIGLSIWRIITPGIELWHLLLPGYVIALILSRLAPPLFVGIAFDSGGVASGPMTATFVLAFAQGVAGASSGSMSLVDAFGVIALVALTPIIALQVFGLIYARKERAGRKENNRESRLADEKTKSIAEKGEGSDEDFFQQGQQDERQPEGPIPGKRDLSSETDTDDKPPASETEESVGSERLGSGDLKESCKGTEAPSQPPSEDGGELPMPSDLSADDEGKESSCPAHTI